MQLIWKHAEGGYEEEARRRLNSAFDILFDEVLKRQKR